MRTVSCLVNKCLRTYFPFLSSKQLLGTYLKKDNKKTPQTYQGGVKKGAFDEATAQARFEAWKNNKQANLAAIVSKNEQAKRDAAKAALEAEKKVNEAIAQKVAEKKAAAKMAEAEAAAEAATEEAPATEEA